MMKSRFASISEPASGGSVTFSPSHLNPCPVNSRLNKFLNFFASPQPFEHANDVRFVSTTELGVNLVTSGMPPVISFISDFKNNHGFVAFGVKTLLPSLSVVMLSASM